MDNREEFPLKLEDDAFPQPAHGGQAPTFQLRHPRIEGPQQRRRTNAHGLDDLPENALLQRTNVCGDLQGVPARGLSGGNSDWRSRTTMYFL